MKSFMYCELTLDIGIRAVECLGWWISDYTQKNGCRKFHWFLHTMLFVHTERIIERQKAKERKQEGMDLDDDDESDEDDGDDIY